ncbi:MAG TPA: chemotaxis protein CheW [Hyphomicrobium sp.]|nr:chemotaxis protein CheW [Hyphomicrobium sp.]
MATAATEAQYVTFSLADEVFAVSVAAVREILDYRKPFKIPHGPDYLLGLTDVRGQGVPSIDLRQRLGLTPTQPTPHTRILVLDVSLAKRQLCLGLVADRVFEVATFTSDQIEAAPDIGVRWRSEYIAGVVRRPEGFVILIDLASLFSSDESALRSQAAA